jgi:hypothetical protein
VASIQKRMRNGQLRWYGRYRDPGGMQLVKVFGRKLDAERFLTTVEASKLSGSYIDAKRASITFRASWSQTLAPGTVGCTRLQTARS